MVIGIQSCNSEVREVTLQYENGEPEQVKIYRNGKSDSTNYTLMQYNVDGTVEMKGEIRNGKEEGTFTWYYPNGNKKWIETFEKGISTDTIYCYYENGNLKRKAHPPYRSNRKSIEYYETGELKIVSFINDGESIDSTWTAYYQNGRIKETGRLMNGRRLGYWKYYDYDGQLIDSVEQSGRQKVVFDFEEEEVKYQEERASNASVN
jgi:uncharacterized protein